MNDICYKELILEDAHLLSEFLKSADRLFPIPLSEKQNLDVLTQKLLLSGKVVGAYYEKNLIGAICGYANDTENRCAYISVLCVLPDFQGKSVARNLLMKFIEISKQQMMNTVFLYTHHTNQRAVRLYEKSGFSPVPSAREGDIKLVLKFRR